MEKVSLKTFTQMVKNRFEEDGIIKGINVDSRFKDLVIMLYKTYTFEMMLSKGLTAELFLESCDFNYDEINPVPHHAHDS
jgi:hypothetical protein